jgi:hypothetical protein
MFTDKQSIHTYIHTYIHGVHIKIYRNFHQNFGSLPYIGRFQVINIQPVYTSNISHLLTQFNPIILCLNPTKYHYSYQSQYLWYTLNNNYHYGWIKDINIHTWNMIIWTTKLNSSNQVETLIIKIKLYKRFHIYKT